MKHLLTGLLILACCTGCAGVSKAGSGAWNKTKALFGAGEKKPAPKKVTVETYPARTTISTLEQPKVQVESQPQKVEVQPRTGVDISPAAESAPAPEQEPDRSNLTPEERQIQEKIDRDVERLRKKHRGGGIMKVFK